MGAYPVWPQPPGPGPRSKDLQHMSHSAPQSNVLFCTQLNYLVTLIGFLHFIVQEKMLLLMYHISYVHLKISKKKIRIFFWIFLDGRSLNLFFFPEYLYAQFWTTYLIVFFTPTTPPIKIKFCPTWWTTSLVAFFHDFSTYGSNRLT